MPHAQFVALELPMLKKRTFSLGSQLGATRLDGAALLATNGPTHGVRNSNDRNDCVQLHAPTRRQVGRATWICQVNALTLARALKE